MNGFLKQNRLSLMKSFARVRDSLRISMRCIWIWQFWEQPDCMSAGMKKMKLCYFSPGSWENYSWKKMLQDRWIRSIAFLK